MHDQLQSLEGKVALITGAARRLGAAIAGGLHGGGANVVVHYNTSRGEAQQLVEALNRQRPGSAVAIQCDLLSVSDYERLIGQTASQWGRLDVLVNNASSFYPTPLGTVTEAQWEDLVGTNLKAPFFLSQAAAPHLAARDGSIVNMVDVYGEQPLAAYPVYSLAKAGLIMLTKALACELGPKVRVNAVAPGTILWPERPFAERTKRDVLAHTLLQRQGRPEEIARAVLFLVRDATYTTGRVVGVDGGRALTF